MPNSLLDSHILAMSAGMLMQPGVDDPLGGACLIGNWYVVQTVPNAEYMALRNLIRAGFECHLPRFVTWRRAMKHGRPVVEQGKPKEEEAIRPFFPGYLFVRFDVETNTRWSDINRMAGVKKLFSRHGSIQPSPVPDDVVHALMNKGRAGDGVIDERAPTFDAIPNGSRIRIKEGAFASIEGLLKCSDQERVMALVSVFGGEREVSLPRASVERLSH